MTRRTTKRRRSRRTWATLILVTAAVIAAVYFWRAQPVDDVPADTQGRSRVQQPADAPSGRGAEDFSAAERQGLEDVLKRRDAGSRR